MGKADLHAHTCHDGWGDGNQTVEEVFRFVEEETDLDLFAITDHDNADTARAAWDIYRSNGYRFGFLPGVEVTNQGGHLLCYFPSGEVPDIPSLRPFWWTVRYARERGAICVAAHPVYPPWLGTTIARGLKAGERIEGVEGVNASIAEKPHQRMEALSSTLASSVAVVGNSDAHHVSAIATAYTEFPGHTVDDYLRALEARQTEAVLLRRPLIPPEARSFTTRRSMMRPGWLRNVWREIRT